MFMLIYLFLSAFWAQPGDLQVTVTHIAKPKGQIFMAVYADAGSFLIEEKAAAKFIVPASATGSVNIVVPALKPGWYAVACYHDANNNGHIDKNLFGVPTEAYCFSNNVRPRTRAPNWEEAKFEISSQGKQISIRLEKW